MKRATHRMRNRLALVVVASAVLLSACIPTTPTQQPAFTKGFDACAAPSLTTMSKWKTSSPYSSVGVYIGGTNRACAQPNRSSTQLRSVSR